MEEQKEETKDAVELTAEEQLALTESFVKKVQELAVEMHQEIFAMPVFTEDGRVSAVTKVRYKV